MEGIYEKSHLPSIIARLLAVVDIDAHVFQYKYNRHLSFCAARAQSCPDLAVRPCAPRYPALLVSPQLLCTWPLSRRCRRVATAEREQPQSISRQQRLFGTGLITGFEERHDMR